MSGMMKTVMGIICVVVAFILMPIILNADYGLITDAQADSSLSANTSAGVTTANVTLTKAIHNDALASVTAISSNCTSGSVDNVTMTADAWVPASKQLTVGALTANISGRALTVTYDYGALDTYTGIESLAYIAPTLVFVGLMFGGGLLVFTGVRASSRSKKSKR